MRTLLSGFRESGGASFQKEPETSRSQGAGSFLPCCQAPSSGAPIPSHRGLAPFLALLREPATSRIGLSAVQTSQCWRYDRWHETGT